MTAAAEFNFYFDPESAYVVLNQLKCPITLVPWEVCERHSLSWVSTCTDNLSLVARKPVFGVSDKVRLKPVC